MKQRWILILSVLCLTSLVSCLDNAVEMQGIQSKSKGVNPDLDPTPEPTPEPTTEPTPQPTQDPQPPPQPTEAPQLPEPTPLPSPKVTQNPMCGGGDESLYLSTVQLVKAQGPKIFNSWGECRAWMDQLYGNSYNCSKMVSSTIFGCALLQSGQWVFEADFALPVFKATNQMEVPYEYYLFNLPGCQAGQDFLNTFSSATAPTVGEFTAARADIHAECVGASTMVIQILRIYP